MTDIPFPDVPPDPGVPPLPRPPGQTFASVVALFADTPSVVSLLSAGPQWGIFKGGAPVVIADTVTQVSFKQAWVLANYPIERGAFESYDKVQTPFDARVRFTSGGNQQTRATLLASIGAIAGDMNLYDVVTPERVYLNCNVFTQGYERSSRSGVGLLSVDVFLQEIRILNGGGGGGNTGSPGAGNAGAASSPNTGSEGTVTSGDNVVNDPQSASGFDAFNGGQVQPAPFLGIGSSPF